MNNALHRQNRKNRKTEGRKPGRTRFALIAVLATFATMFTSLVAFASGASAMTTTEQVMANAMFKLLNQERAANHEPALVLSSKLVLSARRHDYAMARANVMSHQLPGEANFGTRITLAGYHWQAIAENIGWNSLISTSGVLALQKYMYTEAPPNDDHRINILNRTYHNVGIDVMIDSVHHRVWFTQDFGLLW